MVTELPLNWTLERKFGIKTDWKWIYKVLFYEMNITYKILLPLRFEFTPKKNSQQESALLDKQESEV